MRKVFLLVSTGVLFTVSACSGNSQKTASKNAPAVVQASTATANASVAAKPGSALPVPSIRQANPEAWQYENVRDHYGDAVALKTISLDGKFDLVVLQRGRYSFVSFARHGRWESVHELPGKGKLMYLRVEFEDGQEKQIQWDEIGSATEQLCGVLWSYPAMTDASIGQAAEGQKGDSVGGDQQFVQEMLKHKTMLLEVEPGTTAQFDMTGLAREMEVVRTPQTQPVLEARQSAE